MSKRLDKSFPGDDVDLDDLEDDARSTGGSGDDDRQDPNPGSAPEDVPSLVEELEASDNPLMQRLGQELRDRDSREDALRNELAAVKRDAEQRQAIRDYEENAPTKFRFPPDAIKRAIELFVIPSLRDDTIRRFYSGLEVSANTQASVTRAFSLVKLTKSARNKIYGRRLRDSRLSTKPRSLSEGETAMYTKEQLAKEKIFSQMHEDFAPVLQVLYHFMLHIAGFSNPSVDEDYFAYMEELSFIGEDLVQILLDYFGQHIAGPRRELYEKVTGLPVHPGKVEHGFMTEAEAEAAMLVAQQQDLLQQHIAARAPNPSSRGRGKGKGKGGGPNRRPGGLHLQRQQQQRQQQRGQPPSQQQQQQQQQSTAPQQQPSQQQQQQPPASAGTPAKSQKKSTTPGKGNRGGGKGK